MKYTLGKDVLPVDVKISLSMTLHDTDDIEGEDLKMWEHIITYYNLRDQYLDKIRKDYYRLILEKMGFPNLDEFLYEKVGLYYSDNLTIEELLSDFDKYDLKYVPLKELLRIAIVERWVSLCVNRLDAYHTYGTEYDLPEPPELLKK